MAGRRRDLSDEERALWKRVARTAKPIGRDGEGGTAGDIAAEEPTPAPRPVAPPRPPSPRPPSPRGEPLPLTGLDRRTEQRLRRGAAEVDGRIDLHGMTQRAAHAALRRFLAEAQGRGWRLVLVITGKGGAAGGEDDFMSDPRGVLRRQVPHWLSGPETRPLVSGFMEAHHRHGGSGALYVRVRRAR